MIADFIECENCGHKMKVNFDEHISEDGDLYEQWWFSDYIED